MNLTHSMQPTCNL